ncbi:hypothetical protein GCM10010156_62220 [Planobispora rosea]|uniref:N-acetyltransferase domain-containing protein n=1 Tax=Planobispora rosea TaxID=35762 RepID=A0A8J3WFN4_PLARO|nr:bifunctional GNAT family N-acetyltransferase/class I SAM-dependent methyltransferase [Planobispora rosea]GGS95533.1 hypothetical protein GCM10010156_62220 [Planobispora rosea]GIH87513.1 hypothetical protein Pro02_59210 [Planobispora rosea]
MITVAAPPPVVATAGTRAVGIGRYVVAAGRGDTAEAAFSVVDDHRGRGVGRMLLDALSARAAEGGHDAVFAFECLHDMSRPVETLAAIRRAIKPGGSVVVMDEAAAESLTAPADDTERLLYGFSLLVCLPDGMAHQPSAATGTVMRPDTLRRYAAEAGFRDVEVLPIEDFGFWRFYRLLI